MQGRKQHNRLQVRSSRHWLPRPMQAASRLPLNYQSTGTQLHYISEVVRSNRKAPLCGARVARTQRPGFRCDSLYLFHSLPSKERATVVSNVLQWLCAHMNVAKLGRGSKSSHSATSSGAGAAEQELVAVFCTACVRECCRWLFRSYTASAAAGQCSKCGAGRAGSSCSRQH
jgi:hypothetical protein